MTKSIINEGGKKRLLGSYSLAMHAAHFFYIHLTTKFVVFTFDGRQRWWW